MIGNAILNWGERADDDALFGGKKEPGGYDRFEHTVEGMYSTSCKSRAPETRSHNSHSLCAHHIILFSVWGPNTPGASAHRREEEVSRRQGRHCVGSAVIRAGGRTGEVRALGLAMTRFQNPIRGGGLGSVRPPWAECEVRIAPVPAAIGVLNTDAKRIQTREAPMNSSNIAQPVSVSLHRTDTGTSINAATKRAKFD